MSIQHNFVYVNGGNIIDKYGCVLAMPGEYDLAYRSKQEPSFFVIVDGQRIKNEDGYVIVDTYGAENAVTVDGPAGFKYIKASNVLVMDDGDSIGNMGQMFVYKDDDTPVSMVEALYTMEIGMCVPFMPYKTVLDGDIIDGTVPSMTTYVWKNDEFVKVDRHTPSPSKAEMLAMSHDVAIARFMWEKGLSVPGDDPETAGDDTHDETPGDNDAGDCPMSWAAQGVHDYVMMGAIASIYGMAATDDCDCPVISRAIEACAVFQANYHIIPNDHTRRLFALGILGIIMELPEEYAGHVNAYEEAFKANNW